jgi:hypothetical protein
MKPIFYAGILSTIFASVNAQQSKNYDVNKFSNLTISGAAEVIFTQADSTSLKVVTTEKQFENISIRQEDNTLYLRTKGNYKEDIVFYLSAPSIRSLEISGASNFKSKNKLTTDSLFFNASGASNIKADIANQFISLVLSGASDIKFTGTTDFIRANISGASSLKSYSLTAKKADVVASGASSAKLFVTEKVVANATGASSIRLKGNAPDIKADASSSSSISKVIDENTSISIGVGGTTNNPDSTFINLGGKKIIIIAGKNAGDTINSKHKHGYDEDDFKHWAGFSMGVNGYLAPNFNSNMETKYKYMDLDYSRSFNFQFNLGQLQLDLYKKYITLNTGIGFDYHIYALNNKTNLRADSSFTWGTIDSSNTFDFKRNRFRNTYLQVPLLVEFNTNKNPYKSFHVAIGVVGQYLIASRTKQVLTQNGNTFEKVRKDNYNLAPIGFKGHVSVGYSNFTMFGEYNLNEMFKSGQGPKLNAFTVGVRLVPFT